MNPRTCSEVAVSVERQGSLPFPNFRIAVAHSLRDHARQALKPALPRLAKDLIDPFLIRSTLLIILVEAADSGALGLGIGLAQGLSLSICILLVLQVSEVT